MDVQEMRDLLEYGWGIIANAGGGDWGRESDDWIKAAINWRDRYHDMIDKDEVDNTGPGRLRGDQTCK